MAEIRRYGFFSHLRAEPNQFILHFRKGKLVRKGAGLAYWFSPLSASLAQVPVEDIEATFVFRELSADFQEVTVQLTLRYRCADPELAAARVSFTISPSHGVWLEQPLERLASLWSQRAQRPARAYLMGVPLVEAVRAGAQVIQGAVEEALRNDPEIQAGGLALVSLQVNRVSPTAELEKALQTPTREAIQQKADEASFQRRAMAVEKERAIKENELATEIELARRQEELIRQQGANHLQAIRQDAEAEKARVEAEAERRVLLAESMAQETRVIADAEASALRLKGEAEADAEARRVAAWKEAPAHVVLGLSLGEVAGKIGTIQHLNVTPDLLGDFVRRMVEEKANT
ncbi:MAG TPA: SPFH domain-containing protein [Thermoanaerobaculia bacterium]